MEKQSLNNPNKAYLANTTPQIVEVKTPQFLSIVGTGEPTEKEHIEKIKTLFTTAYTLKFIFKAINKDFTVSKLKCLWWFDKNEFGKLPFADTTLNIHRNEWKYRLLIQLPNYVTQTDIEQAIKITIEKEQLPIAAIVELYEMADKGRSYSNAS